MIRRSLLAGLIAVEAALFVAIVHVGATVPAHVVALIHAFSRA